MISHTTRTNVYAPLRVLIYSSNASIRTRIRQVLGHLVDNRVVPMVLVDLATAPAVMQQMVSGKTDLAILDGEASPSGGLGLAKQLKDELLQCPPIVVLTGRAEDSWLARWSRADAIIARPVDPVVLSGAVLSLLQSRLIA
ncbi:two-component system response regulator [Mycobacterium lentiflavum]|uniref:Two-component system response regulator n=1 Tax=Mycobacterium lentiflavum TaxID=141349 RepID=A0A0E4H2N6_MYCLN|nr:response regulator transcription factor [Mycobacterium lentiflavum]CQD22939.1 two-component system response regulator [Mycobacterium lentiflavum]